MTDSLPPLLADVRALAERLFPPLSATDGTPETALADAEQRLGFSLPPLLREYYRLAGERDDLNQARHRLLPPAYLFVRQQESHGAVLIFHAPEDGTGFAGVAVGGGENPPVVLLKSDGQEKYSVDSGPPLSEFLREVLIDNAAQGGLAWCAAGQTDGENLRDAAPEWERIAFRDGTSALLKEGRVLRTVAPIGSGGVRFLVYAGARTAGDLRTIVLEFGISVSQRVRRPDAPPEADAGQEDLSTEARGILRLHAAQQAAASGEAACAGCGASLRTWADNVKGVCSLCGRAL